MSQFRLRGAIVERVEQARRFRHNQTDAEEVLWQMLRDRQLRGIKFRRQTPMGRFILDFYCPAARLVIELMAPSMTSSRSATRHVRRSSKRVGSG